MRRKRSASTLKSDSGPEEVYPADAASSGNASELEKDDAETPQDFVNESTSLLGLRRATYGGSTLKEDDKEEFWDVNGQSLPTVIYASPAQPHLPSPSASSSRVPGTFSIYLAYLVTNGVFLPHNWRTPAMVPYDVQAHPFNRAPNAVPQATSTRNRFTPTNSEGTGGSSRSSVWSVELESGPCGCLSRYVLFLPLLTKAFGIFVLVERDIPS
jgi:hypothetical protein